MTEMVKMPTLWHFRGKSDRDWIASRMRAVPEHLRAEVAQGYDKIFMPNVNNTGRKDANEWLDKEAAKYRSSNEQPRVRRVKLKDKPVPRPTDETTTPRGKRVAQSDCGLWSKKL